MRHRGVLNEEHSAIFARIVTDLCLPATIFVGLAGKTIRLSQLTPAMVMLSSEVLFIGLSLFISARLGFSKAKRGAIVFCSTFGSSTFLGYSLIMQMYPHQPEALTEAILVSEIGVGYPIFILGPILAAYFGSAQSSARSAWVSSLHFFKSPLFFALIAGFLWALLQLPGEESILMAPAFRLCRILASAMIPLAILSVGLMFRMPKVREIVVALGEW